TTPPCSQMLEDPSASHRLAWSSSPESAQTPRSARLQFLPRSIADLALLSAGKLRQDPLPGSSGRRSPPCVDARLSPALHTAPRRPAAPQSLQTLQSGAAKIACSPAPSRPESLRAGILSPAVED